MDAAERDGYDTFQWTLGPILAIGLGYQIIKIIKDKGANN